MEEIQAEMENTFGIVCITCHSVYTDRLSFREHQKIEHPKPTAEYREKSEPYDPFLVLIEEGGRLSTNIIPCPPIILNPNASPSYSPSLPDITEEDSNPGIKSSGNAPTTTIYRPMYGRGSGRRGRPPGKVRLQTQREESSPIRRSPGRPRIKPIGPPNQGSRGSGRRGRPPLTPRIDYRSIFKSNSEGGEGAGADSENPETSFNPMILF